MLRYSMNYILHFINVLKEKTYIFVSVAFSNSLINVVNAYGSVRQLTNPSNPTQLQHTCVPCFTKHVPKHLPKHLYYLPPIFNANFKLFVRKCLLLFFYFRHILRQAICSRPNTIGPAGRALRPTV